MTALATGVIAHMGGLDEIGIFVVPALLVIVFLRWAERRARRQEADEEASPDVEGPGADG